MKRPLPLEMTLPGDFLVFGDQEFRILCVDSDKPPETIFKVADGTTEVEFSLTELELLGVTAVQPYPLPTGTGAIVRDADGRLWVRRHHPRAGVDAAVDDWLRVDGMGATCSGLLQQKVAEVVSEGTDVWQ